MLVIREEHTIRALLRAIISAKFSPNVNDQLVPASPFVAKLARDAAKVLEEAEVQRDGKLAKSWTEWRDFGTRRTEWDAAVQFATEAFATHWSGWTDEQRASVVRDLVSPFEISAGNYLKFVGELEARFASVDDGAGGAQR